MRTADKLALNLVPLFLRISLAATFLWAGGGKLFDTVELGPAQLDILSAPPAAAEAPADTPAEEDTPTLPEPTEAEDDGPEIRSLTDPPASESTGESAAALPAGYSLALAQDTEEDAAAETDSASDIAPSNERRKLVFIALTIHSAVNPEQGSPRLPAFMGTHKMKLAWAVALTEFLGGLAILVGLLTRFWAIALTGVSAGIVWITEIGPAAMGGIDNPMWGFLPPLWPFNPGAGMHFFFTLGLLLTAMSLVLTGAGALSADRVFFGRPRTDADDNAASVKLPDGA